METESKPSERETFRSSSLSSLSDSDSDTEIANDAGRRSNDLNSHGKGEKKVEWLATTRKRRSTAGNRMKSMLANEEPDSDLELLFAEDENDQGFSDVDENGSDVHMDSSDDDDDNDNHDDDLEGEKELERQAKERRAAQRKRKAQEAIPAKFRKKVRIESTTKTRAAPVKPAPRPKKKSERSSWLPSAADLPTRASSRQTTRISKEQLHQQMVEREERRLKQLAQMQKKAARLDAMKKPPMTQEERLREAAIVEKRNSKSLNRWEVAEKQREEERRAKLAALHQRTLKGPVITFWSGIGEWMGRHMVIEEPAKEKKKRGEKAKGKEKDKDKAATVEGTKQDKEGTQNGTPAADDAASKAKSEAQTTQQPPSTTASTGPIAASGPDEAISAAKPQVDDGVTEPPKPSPVTQNQPPLPVKAEEPPRSMAMPPPPPPTASGLAAPAPPPSTPPPPSPLAHPAGGLAAPSPAPTTTTPDHQQSVMPPPPGLARPSEHKPSGVLAAPVLAPPFGISVNGAAPPGYGNHKSNVLALPNTSQGVVPPSLSTVARPHSSPVAPPKPTTEATPSIMNSTLKDMNLRPIPNPLAVSINSASPDPSAQPPEPQPPQPSTGARNAFVFQNFDDNALKDRSVQTQIIFGRKMNKLAKPSPAPLCVITNHPARYRDPGTGLPYFNAYAYREIQRLSRGEYRWSRILGAWVGSGTYAARGVPERFLNPDKKGPEKKKETLAGEDVKGSEAVAKPHETKAPDATKDGAPMPEDTVVVVEEEAKQPLVSQPEVDTVAQTAPGASTTQPPAASIPVSTAPAPHDPTVVQAPVAIQDPAAVQAPAPAPPSQQSQPPTSPPLAATGTAPIPVEQTK
ncbi:hypothetical protein FZEAL_291 [Fusarium zealandicum]|uniref:Vps72/YL1 C-terminal domain-containing protein n=1 Tax=Fusarium zealandicum TaxID=1053134 RepID=A0A8H4UVM8_9HYPO|nr:hypothetical protein FZEAL_291 [Fusarium zealandicum]